MASKSALFFALLFIAIASMANAVIVDGTSFKVSGSLDCSGTPIADTTVSLSLNGNQDFVASGVTTVSGSFVIEYVSQTQVTLDTTKAVVCVKSPVANCASFNLPNTYVCASLTLVKNENGVYVFTAGEFAYPS